MSLVPLSHICIEVFGLNLLSTFQKIEDADFFHVKVDSCAISCDSVACFVLVTCQLPTLQPFFSSFRNASRRTTGSVCLSNSPAHFSGRSQSLGWQ